MKKIGFISFILLCCYFTFITPAQADKTSQEVEFYEEVEEAYHEMIKRVMGE